MGAWLTYPLAEGSLSFKTDAAALTMDERELAVLRERQQLVEQLWRECAEKNPHRSGGHRGHSVVGGVGFRLDGLGGPGGPGARLENEPALPPPPALESYCSKYPNWTLFDLQNLK